MLTLERPALDEILSHARTTHPEECCGAILQTPQRQIVRQFTNIQNRLHAADPANNPRDARTAYMPESRELLAVLREGESAETRLLAFYHSHTKAGAYFSGEDRARAMFGDEPAYPEVIYVVVSDNRVSGETRAFQWDDGARDFPELALVIRG